MLKRTLLVILLCLMLFSISRSAKALTIREVPNPLLNNQGWVTDMANLLSPETEAQLNQIISDFKIKTGNEIAVVTVPDTAPSSTPKEFATALFKYWQLDRTNYWRFDGKGQNKGVLFLVSLTERRVEIKTSKSAMVRLSNARVKKIIQSEIIPHFKLGEFSLGIVLGTQALISSLSGSGTLPNDSLAGFYREAGLYGLIGLIVVVIRWGMVSASHNPSLQPEGRSRQHVYTSVKNQAAKCARCRLTMEKLDSQSLLSYLSQPEQVAQTLGSVSFDGWHCQNCYPKLTEKGIHIRAYIVNSTKFKPCSTCQELTVERTSTILEPATTEKEGQKLVIEKCHCCDYYQANVKIIPMLSDSYDSSDGGSGSFGGDGGSDGGGDGGSW